MFGVGKVEDFTWTGMLDMATCTECGRCQSQCPAWNTGKPLSPKLLIMNLRDHLFAKAPYVLGDRTAPEDGVPDFHDVGTHSGHAVPESGYERVMGTTPEQAVRPLVGTAEEGGVIDPDVLWSCTTCGACVEQCPVDIEHVDHILDMRRYQVLIESAFPSEAGVMLRNLENKGNPWGLNNNAREDWTEGLSFEVRRVEDTIPDDVEYLFWVGCAGALEDRSKKVTRAFAELMHTAGVEFAILGAGESCTGDPARRLGNEFVFQMLAQQNVEVLNEAGVKKIVATCPHCFNTLANEYTPGRRLTTRSSTTPSCSASWSRPGGWCRSPRSTRRSPTTTPATSAGTTGSTPRRARCWPPFRACSRRRCRAARSAGSAAAPAAPGCGWRRRSASRSTWSGPTRRSGSTPT